MPKKAKDISGMVFGRLTALEFAGKQKEQRMWKCKCECGREVIVQRAGLFSGNTSSCGCAGRHGLTKTPTYISWSGMKVRCFNKNRETYKDYGGRGITVCDLWKKDFLSFLADMGERPSKEYSIDRIDNNGNYSCGHCDECIQKGWTANCRWSTRREQRLNQRKTKRKGAERKRFLIHDGKKMSAIDVAKILGVHVSVIYKQLARKQKEDANGDEKNI